ncbi:hypothetical protein Brsp06_04925 [Brucella sp. NBRC 13694]
MKPLLWVLVVITILLIAGALLRGTGPQTSNEQNSPHSLQTDPPN